MFKYTFEYCLIADETYKIVLIKNVMLVVFYMTSIGGTSIVRLQLVGALCSMLRRAGIRVLSSHQTEHLTFN